MFSSIFIDRPRFAVVIAIVITLAGANAISAIPIAQFPEIVRMNALAIPVLPCGRLLIRLPGSSACMAGATILVQALCTRAVEQANANSAREESLMLSSTPSASGRRSRLGGFRLTMAGKWITCRAGRSARNDERREQTVGGRREG